MVAVNYIGFLCGATIAQILFATVGINHIIDVMPFAAFAANLIIVVILAAVDADVIAVNVANIVVFNVFATTLATACIPVYTFGAPACAPATLVGVNFCCIVTPEHVAATLTGVEQFAEAILAVLLVIATSAHIAQSYDFAAIMANAIFVGTVWAKPTPLDITPAVLNGFGFSTAENLATICTFSIIFHVFHNIFHPFYKSVGGW